MNPKTLLAILVLAATTVAHGKSCEEIEKEVKTAFEETKKLQDSDFRNRISGEEYEAIYKKVGNIIAQNAEESWECHFSEVSDDLTITTSEDKKFRTYNWFDYGSGTMHYDYGLWQYRDAKGNTHTMEPYEGLEFEEDLKWRQGNYVTGVYRADLGDKGIAYFVAEAQHLSTMLVIIKVELLRIVGDKVERVPRIKDTDTEKYLTNLSNDAPDYNNETYTLKYEYNFRSVLDNPALDDHRERIHFFYDDKRKILFHPLIVPDENYSDGKMFEARVEYIFDGDYFIRVDNYPLLTALFRIEPSLTLFLFAATDQPLCITNHKPCWFMEVNAKEDV